MMLRSRMLAYCACSLGFSILSSIFSFYYVKVFLNYFHIDESWFQLSQILYLVWNMINDPLFAYLQDTTNFKFTKTRRESILYAAPLFSLSFIITWFPWANGTWVTGLHLITALCLYDTMFTYVGLAYCCLFTEISTDTKVRLQLTQWSNISGLLGSFSVFICEFTSDNLKSFEAFQWTTVVLAIVATLSMTYAGMYAHTEHDLNLQNLYPEKEVQHKKSNESSIWRLTWQILSDRNFISFVISNFCQVFHRTFYGNFVAIFCDELISKDVLSSALKKTYYGSFSIATALVVIVGVPIIHHVGYYRFIKWSFTWKIGAGLFMLCFGRQYLILLMIYIFLDNVLSGAASSMFNIPLSDVADHDMKKYNRSHPISSMVYGTNALIVKPAQSLNPMLTVAILNIYGYKSHKDGKLDAVQLASLKDVMFYLICAYSIILGIVQLISWSMFITRPKQFHETQNVISV